MPSLDPLTIAALGTQALTGIVDVGTGLLQEGRAKKLAQANKRPFYNIPGGITDNTWAATSRASQGLSDQAKSLYTEQSDRGLTAGIDAITSGGGSVNNIADLYAKRDNGISNMALIDEGMRAANMKNLYDANTQQSEYADKEWQVNDWGPFADKAQAAAAIREKGATAIEQGKNAITGAFSNVATANQYQKNIDTVYGKKPPISNPVILNNPGLQMGAGNHTPQWDPSQQAFIDPNTGELVYP